MVADGQADMKTPECTEGVAKAVQAMHGDSFSASRIDPGHQLDQFRREDQTSHSPLQGRRRGRERRCGAQVMSLTLEDAHNDSHRWLTSHRQNLYSSKDHLQPATSSALLNRIDEFMDFNSIRLVRQQFPEK